MARLPANRALSLSLAVIAAFVLAVTAGVWFADTHSVAHDPAVDGPIPAPPVAGQLPPTAGSAEGSPPSTRVHGTAPPGIPVRLTIESPQGRSILSGPIDPIAASRNANGTWAPINPPTRSHAVWVRQSSPPAAPSTGTTAIYGHACIGYTCVFNHAFLTPLGSTVTIATNRAVLRYRVTAITQYPKTGARSLASRPTIADQLILVTCAYRPDRTTVNNLVITATLFQAASG